MKEIKSLTGIRGIASLYVVIYHFYKFYLNVKPENPIKFNRYLHSFFDHGYLGVDLFFILSAFVITLSSKKYFDGKFLKSNYFLFMKKRCIRIFPAYLFALLCAYIFIEHFHRVPNLLISLTLLNSLLGVSYMIQPFWSLSTEWVAYIIYPVFFKISFYKKSLFWIAIVAFLGILILYINSAFIWNNLRVVPNELSVYQGFPSLFRCFGNYFLGMAAYHFFSKRVLLLKSNLLGSLVSIGIITLLFSPLTDFIIVILFTLLIVTITNEQDFAAKLLGSKLIHFLGLISYPLYLIHALIVFFLKDILIVLSKMHIDVYRYLILFFIFMAISLLSSFLVTFYVEKPIVSYFSKRLKYKRFHIQLR